MQDLRTVPDLAIICICWFLLILALVFACIQQILWVTAAEDTAPSSTVASHSESGLAGWTDRKPFCLVNQLSDVCTAILKDDPLLWRFEDHDAI